MGGAFNVLLMSCNYVNQCFNLFNNCSKNLENVNVVIDWHVKLKTGRSSVTEIYADYYSRMQISSVYLLKTEKFENISPSNYREFNFTTSFVCSNDFYVCWYCPSGYGNGSNVIIQDYYYTVHYYFYFSVLKNYYLFDCIMTVK